MTSKMKWAYTFFLLIMTLAWAVFTVQVVGNAIADPSSINVIEASGTSVFLGALIAWNGNVNQHWFRKKLANGDS